MAFGTSIVPWCSDETLHHPSRDSYLFVLNSRCVVDEVFAAAGWGVILPTAAMRYKRLLVAICLGSRLVLV